MHSHEYIGQSNWIWWERIIKVKELSPVSAAWNLEKAAVISWQILRDLHTKRVELACLLNTAKEHREEERSRDYTKKKLVTVLPHRYQWEINKWIKKQKQTNPHKNPTKQQQITTNKQTPHLKNVGPAWKAALFKWYLWEKTWSEFLLLSILSSVQSVTYTQSH